MFSTGRERVHWEQMGQKSPSLMKHLQRSLFQINVVSKRTQENDDSYYLWSMRYVAIWGSTVSKASGTGIRDFCFDKRCLQLFKVFRNILLATLMDFFIHSVSLGTDPSSKPQPGNFFFPPRHLRSPDKSENYFNHKF